MVKKLMSKALVICFATGLMMGSSLYGYDIETNSERLSFSVYGELWMKINDIDDPADQEALSFDYDESRLGLKGEYLLSTQLKAFWSLEFGYNDEDTHGSGNALGQRSSFVGLESDHAGRLSVGRQDSYYKVAGVSLDPFNDTASGAGKGGPNYGLSGYTGGFFSDTLSYRTPDMSGFKLNAAIMIDDSNNKRDDHSYNVGGSYECEKWVLWLQYLDFNEMGAEMDLLRVSSQIKLSQLTLAASYENEDDDVNVNSRDYYYLTGSYHFGASSKSKVSLSYGNVSSDLVADKKDGKGYAIGIFRDLAFNATIYALYSTVDRDDLTDRKVTSFGFTQRF